jgi:hypothetical protein
MKIVSKNAANLFFPTTSLEFVYYEAIANSIDAGASRISIDIEINSFAEEDTLRITITDNGVGFNDRNFEKFNNVLDVEDKQHKGIGRLVYLKYFQNVFAESKYGNKFRKFLFNNEFDGENEVTEIPSEEYETKLIFSNYIKDKIKKYEYLVPKKVRDSILEHFLPRFYTMKLDKKELKLIISLNTNTPSKDYEFYNDTIELDISRLPELKEKSIPDTTKLFGEFKMLYSVDKTYENSSVISALCADGRTVPMPIISEKEFPVGYKMVFILYSDYFNGKANSTREVFTIDDNQLNYIKKVFTQLISEVIKEEIPEIVKENKKIQDKLQNQYPHLVGYFDEDSIGLVDKTSIINSAQEKYFNDQKEILEASELSDEQYELSLNFSSRILTEYILYRTKIIKKLKEMNKDNDECEIHNLIVPKKKVMYQNGKMDAIFLNNAWVLDDKYMSYSKVLSDVEVEKIYMELDVQGSHVYSEIETGRPDITIVFSRDPDEAPKVDVVVIEFKKLGLDLSKREEVFSQLRQRARRLLEFYPNKIQRLWFYGIVDFDKEFEASLIENGFIMLFSEGELFYKSQEIVLNMDMREKKYADIFLLSYDAMISDAETRNSTFLNILKEGIREKAKT